jgi:hypothetical protein
MNGLQVLWIPRNQLATVWQLPAMTSETASGECRSAALKCICRRGLSLQKRQACPVDRRNTEPELESVLGAINRIVIGRQAVGIQ